MPMPERGVPQRPQRLRERDGDDESPARKKEAQERAEKAAREARRARLLGMLNPSIAVRVALVFAACTAIALAAIGSFADVFTNEFGVQRWVFVAVPSLFGALFALVMYTGAEKRIRSIRESLSRSLLVALVTWIAAAGLATFTWCKPEQYGSCFGKSLLLAGLVGGGPLLLAALAGGAIGGFLILRQTPVFRKEG